MHSSQGKRKKDDCLSMSHPDLNAGSQRCLFSGFTCDEAIRRWPMDDDIFPDFLWAFLGGIPFRLRVAVSPPHKACFYAAYMTGFDGYDWPRVGMSRGVIALWGLHV